MKTIWKYQLEVTVSQDILMPEGAVLLAVYEQHGTLCLWALVESNAAQETHQIRIVGTGHAYEGGGDYLGTALTQGGSLVWHVFDETPNGGL